MIKTITISKSNYNYLMKHIEKLNKKADKLNSNRIEVLEEREKFKEEENDITYIPEIELTISYDTIKIGEYKVLAHINHTYDSGNIISVIDNEYKVPEKYYNIDGHCEHCNINHRRKATYLIEDENKNIKQIGKTCIKEYTGYNIDRILNIVEWFENVEEYIENIEVNNEGDRYCKYFNTIDILNISKLVIEKYGYVSKNKQRILQEEKGILVDSTSDIIKYIARDKQHIEDTELRNIYREAYELRNSIKIYDEVKKALEWISEKDEKDITSEYIHNLKVLSSSEYIEYKHIGYIGSLLVAYNNEIAKKNEKKSEKNEKKISEYIGNIGEKLESTVSCKKIIPIESIYGRSLMYIFEDINGNILVWFTSKYDFECNENDTINIKFTVKEHSLYNNDKQTKVIRVKRI